VSIGAYAIVHGGTRIGADATVGHRVIVGEPEYGYAVRHSSSRVSAAPTTPNGRI